MGHILTRGFSTAILFHQDCEEDEEWQWKLAEMQTDLVIIGSIHYSVCLLIQSSI